MQENLLMDKKGPSLEYFSEAKIALIREVKVHWPELMQQLAEQESQDWNDQLSTIAAYCFVLLDGFYLPAQLDELADKLVWKLRAKRKGLGSPKIGVPIDQYGKKLDPKIIH